MDDLPLLRGAIARRDAAVLQEPQGRAAAKVLLQHGGQLVLVTGAAPPEVAEKLRRGLQERGWPGDAVLIDQLDGRLSPLEQVHLDEVADALDSRDGGLLDLHTGTTTRHEVLDILDEEGLLDDDDGGGDAAGRQVEVPGLGAAAAWEDRRLFADGVTDPEAREALTRALDGAGAFGRFSRTLDRWPDLVSAFLTVRDERAHARARHWLHDAGLLQTSRPPSA